MNNFNLPPHVLISRDLLSTMASVRNILQSFYKDARPLFVLQALHVLHQWQWCRQIKETGYPITCQVSMSLAVIGRTLNNLALIFLITWKRDYQSNIVKTIFY